MTPPVPVPPGSRPARHHRARQVEAVRAPAESRDTAERPIDRPAFQALTSDQPHQRFGRSIRRCSRAGMADAAGAVAFPSGYARQPHPDRSAVTAQLGASERVAVRYRGDCAGKGAGAIGAFVAVVTRLRDTATGQQYDGDYRGTHHPEPPPALFRRCTAWRKASPSVAN